MRPIGTPQTNLAIRWALGDTNNKQIKNPNVDPRFQTNTIFGQKFHEQNITNEIEDAKAKNNCIPVVLGHPDGDNKRFLSWHMKGTCYSGCKKGYKHGTKLMTSRKKCTTMRMLFTPEGQSGINTCLGLLLCLCLFCKLLCHKLLHHILYTSAKQC